ncbi:retinoic acid receptor responder protein 2-like [Gastrophryne carolinensis]
MKVSGLGLGLFWALLLVAQGDIAEEQLSDLQNKALRLVMENFHRKGNLKNGYKLATVERHAEEEVDGGMFVSLEVTLKQSKCQREQWTNPECQAARDGKVQSCVGCFKFDVGEQKVRSKYMQCMPAGRAVQERVGNMRRESCKAVKKPKLKPPPTYHVGSVTFMRFR